MHDFKYVYGSDRHGQLHVLAAYFVNNPSIFATLGNPKSMEAPAPVTSNNFFFICCKNLSYTESTTANRYGQAKKKYKKSARNYRAPIGKSCI